MENTSKYLIASPGKVKTSDIELFSIVKDSLSNIEIKIEEFIGNREEATKIGMLTTVEDILIADIRSITKEFKDYSSRRYLELNEDKELIGSLKEQIRVLAIKNKELESSKNDLNNSVKEKESQIEVMARQLRELIEAEKESESDRKLKELDERMNAFMELVESSAKTMAVVKRTKDKDTKTALRTDVSDDTLTKMYLKDKSLSDIAEEVGMTPNGVRTRLIRCGVYKGKNSNFGTKR